MTPVRLEPSALRSRVKHSTTEQCSYKLNQRRNHKGQLFVFVFVVICFVGVFCEKGMNSLF